MLENNNPTQAVDEVINTPVNFDFDDEAEKLGIPEPELRERLEAQTHDPSVHRMDTIPADWQHHLEAIARDVEAQKSVRRLNESSEPQLSPKAKEEPPIMEEEPPKKKRSKRNHSKLTKPKENAIAKERESAKATQAGVAQTNQILNAQLGAQMGSLGGTAFLLALQASENSTIGQGMTIRAAEKLQLMAQLSQQSPLEVIQQLGIPLTPETQEMLMKTMNEVLGKGEAATQATMDTGWGNGISLEEQLSQMKDLLNFND
jgi:hypothetical protein